MNKFLKIFLVFFVLFSMVLSTAMYFYFKDDVTEATANGETQTGDDFESLDVSQYKERTNVLLLGVDTLENTENTKGIRTDTMMVLSIDPVSKTGFILSIPRDSRVKLSGSSNYDKINHAHSYGGTELAISTVKDFLQIPIHHYVKVDYQALFKTVDDLGGVEVYVPIDMKYQDTRATPPLYIDLKKGLQTLNGEQAMGFLRYRKGYANQDLGRIDTQQAFMEALIKKVVSPASITKIPNYINTLYNYVETDMSIKDILILAKQGLSIDLNRIEKRTVEGVPDMINGVSYYVIDDVKKQETINYLLSGDYPVPETIVEEGISEGETGSKSNTTTAKTPVQEPEVDINSYNIQVLNGSGYSGVARRASDLMKIEDITVDYTGNAPNFDYEKTIIYYKDDAKTATKLKDILKMGSIQKGTKSIVSSEPDIIIVLGKDFS